MFMNFMDYSADDCVAMFTTEQAETMRGYLQPGSALYSLTRHPELLERPANNSSNDFAIWPNPAKETINIYFEFPPVHLEAVYIVDVLGRFAGKVSDHRSRGHYAFATASLAPGLYFINCSIEGTILSKPVVVNP
jgi:hypothetical protein